MATLFAFGEWLAISLLCTAPIMIAGLLFIDAMERRHSLMGRLVRVSMSVALGFPGMMLFFYFGGGLAFKALFG